MMRKNFLFVFVAFFILESAGAQNPTIVLTSFATGFSSPVTIAHADDSRLFVVQQRGLIRILNTNGTINSSPFLNITSLVSQSGNERGLLGLAFHPDYGNNGYFYVNYTRSSDGATRVSRFTRDPANADLALANSELNLLTIDQPYSNHNGGEIQFGPDGYLYIGMGDGGSAGDPDGNGQDPLVLLAKMLRIDVDNGNPYGIPATNPFYGFSSVRNEIWAIGMRNPWRFSFDRCTGDLWIADVGQDDWEEIDFEPAGDAGGRNYGWSCYEGTHAYNTSGCNPSGYTMPIFEFSHSEGCSVTGGYVYRGDQEGDLYGTYLFTDFCSGKIWGTKPNGSGGWTTTSLGTFLTNQYGTFGEDYLGELYLAGRTNGIIYKLTTASSAVTLTFTGLDTDYCNTDGAVTLIPAPAGGTFSGSGVTGNTFDPAAAGIGTQTITYTYTDLSGCVKSVVQTTTVNSCTSIDEVPVFSRLNVYPNPAEEILNIEYVALKKTSCRMNIYNTTGQLVYTEIIDSDTGLQKESINISGMNKGVYLLEISSEQGNVVKSFVVVN